MQYVRIWLIIFACTQIGYAFDLIWPSKYVDDLSFNVYIVSSHCGGSLVHPHWILTAARCVMRQRVLVIAMLNVTNPESPYVVNSTEAFVYPKFNELTSSDDIALIHLESPASDTLKTIPLVTNKTFLNAEQKAFYMGFGHPDTTSILKGKLNSVRFETSPVRIITQEICKHYIRVLHSSTVCALDDGKFVPESTICSGDNGGSLIAHDGTKYVLIATAIFKFKHCSSIMPSFYTKLDNNYIDWFEWITEENFTIT